MSELSDIALAYVRTLEPYGASMDDIENILHPEWNKRDVKQACADLVRSEKLKITKGGRFRVKEATDGDMAR